MPDRNPPSRDSLHVEIPTGEVICLPQMPSGLGTAATDGMRILRKVRDTLCYSQGELMDYYARVFDAVADLNREYLLRCEQGGRRAQVVAAALSTEEYSVWKARVDELDSLIETGLVEVVRDLISYLVYVLHDDSVSEDRPLPRICLSLATHAEDGGYLVDKGIAEVLDIWRWPLPADFNSNRRRAEANSGFHQVNETGRCWIGNDLPTRLAAGQYTNRRIREGAVVSPASLDISALNDDAWCALWDDGHSEPRSCYKSTLIVPITLKNNPIRSGRLGLEKYRRAILGYLSFDHPDPKYFSESPHEDIGYIFADLLSHYILCSHLHARSSGVSWARSILKSGG